MKARKLSRRQFMKISQGTVRIPELAASFVTLTVLKSNGGPHV